MLLLPIVLLMWSALAQSTHLEVLVPSEFPDLSTCNTVSGDQNMVKYHVYSRLYTFDDNMQPQPDLVTSEQISDDATVWTLTIREGVKFHDGSPLTAESIKFTIDHMRDSECEQQVLYAPIQEVRVESDTRITLVTAEPFLALRNNLAHPDAAILSPSAIEELGDDHGLNPVGSGPYEFQQWVTGDHITLTRNDDYYGGAPFFEVIDFRFVTDATTRALLVESGDADVALRVLPTDANRMAENEQLEVTKINSRNIIFPMNVTDGPFSNHNARLAANHAVDKETIVDRVLFGAGVPSQSLVETVAGTVPVGFYDYDPDLARSLLEESGYDGAPVTLLSPVGRYPQDSEVAQAVAGYLREVGFDVDLNSISDWPSYVSAVEAGEFGLFMLGWSGSTGDPDNAFRRTLSTPFAGRLWNPGGYSNPEADALLDEAGAKIDVDARNALYAEFQRIVWNDAPWLFMYRQSVFVVHDEAIKGITILSGTEAPLFWTATRE